MGDESNTWWNGFRLTASVITLCILHCNHQQEPKNVFFFNYVPDLPDLGVSCFHWGYYVVDSNQITGCIVLHCLLEQLSKWTLSPGQIL